MLTEDCEYTDFSAFSHFMLLLTSSFFASIITLKIEWCQMHDLLCTSVMLD